MGDNSRFINSLRHILALSLALYLLLGGAYLTLVRQNRARSYNRGVAAIAQAQQFWLEANKDIEMLRTVLANENSNKPFTDNYFIIKALEAVHSKPHKQLLLNDGTSVSVYLRTYFRTSDVNLIAFPGTSRLLVTDKDLLPVNIEVLVAQQDMLLADFLAQTKSQGWALDPLEREKRLNTMPGAISWLLVVNAPGGYEHIITWLSQLLILLSALILLLVPAYVWHDARGRYRRELFWTILAASTNLIGLLIYLLIGRVVATACPECKQAVQDQHKFCPYCRTQIKVECLNCGEPLNKQWRFCAKCGVKPSQSV